MAQLMAMAKQTPTYAKPEAKVSIAMYKKGVLVTGSTYPIKDVLKECEGKWNKTLGGWIFATTSLDDLVEAIRQNKQVELTLGEGVGALTSAKEVVELD